MRGNISDIRQYLKDREALQAMEKELEERMEPEAEPSEKQSPEVPDLDEIIWFFGEEYTVDSQSLEIILQNYTRGMAEQVQSDEAGEDPFHARLIREAHDCAEALRIRLLALNAYELQLDEARERSEEVFDPENMDPDDLPF